MMSNQYAILSRDEYEAMFFLGHHMPLGFHVYTTIKLKYMDHKTFIATGCGYSSIANEYDNDDLQSALSKPVKLKEKFSKPGVAKLRTVFAKLIDAGLLAPLHKKSNGPVTVEYLLPLAQEFFRSRAGQQPDNSRTTPAEQHQLGTQETKQPCGLDVNQSESGQQPDNTIKSALGQRNSLNHYSINTSSSTSSSEVDLNQSCSTQPDTATPTPSQIAQVAAEAPVTVHDVVTNTNPSHDVPVNPNHVLLAIDDSGQPLLTLTDLQRAGLRKLFSGNDQQFESELFSCALDAQHRGMTKTDLFQRARNWMQNDSNRLTKETTGGKQSGQLTTTQASSLPRRRGNPTLRNTDEKFASIKSVVESVRRSTWEADS